jgi:hypothetical protein
LFYGPTSMYQRDISLQELNIETGASQFEPDKRSGWTMPQPLLVEGTVIKTGLKFFLRHKIHNSCLFTVELSSAIITKILTWGSTGLIHCYTLYAHWESRSLQMPTSGIKVTYYVIVQRRLSCLKLPGVQILPWPKPYFAWHTMS